MDMERLNEINNPNSYADYARNLLLDILRHVEADLGAGGGVSSLQNSTIITEPTETHPTEEEHVEQHLVSGVTVTLVSPEFSLASEDSIYAEYEWELENLSEKVDISQLDNGMLDANIHRVRFKWNHGEQYTENHLTTELADNIILVRMIWDFRDREKGNKARLQFIWTSKFSWLEVMQHLVYNTYDFDFNFHAMGLRPNDHQSTDNNMTEAHDPFQRPLAEDGLLTVVITQQHHIDSGDSLICSICHETFLNGEHAKELPCKHLYHRRCILSWFIRRISCPLCRGDEPVGDMLLKLGQ